MPFILVAPLGAIAAGLIATRVGSEVMVAINTPRLLAITHALVLGWVTTTMMGASYQLGPVVLGGRLLSTRLMRVQFAIHALGVAAFVWSFLDWNMAVMGSAGVLLVVSLSMYLVNAGVAVRRAERWSLSRMYLAVSLGFLALTGAFGITFVGTLEHAWFPVTFGRLAAHAHLGLVGWLALTLMGVSYQLVPMFNVTTRVHPRFGGLALSITGTATLLFAAVMLADPPMPVRVVIAVFLASGPLVWGADQVRLLRGRNKRHFDIQGRATVVSTGFLVLAAMLGVGAAVGTPFTTDEEPARWLLAYGAAAILGWAGTAVIGNAIKVVAFLVWVHRYHPHAGSRPLPAIADLYSGRFATAILSLHVLSTTVLIVAALTGRVGLFHIGGLLLAISATGFFACLVSIFVPRQAWPRAGRTRPGSAPVGEPSYVPPQR
ncbi:MAG: hypothetical protein ACSLFM_02220 [Tepidiformaceae bacterium]